MDKETLKAFDVELDKVRDRLMEIEAELMIGARDAPTEENVKLGNAARALLRARHEIDATQYYITKED